MREIAYHRNAVRYLKRMPVDRKEQVKAAIAELARFPDVSLHPNVRSMQAEWAGCHRLRIGSYRAIFQIAREGSVEVVEVLLVGPRGDIY